MENNNEIKARKDAGDIKLVESKDIYKLIIPERVERMIREWCKLNPSTEWSGTLFYTVEGSFENSDIVFTAQDFFVSDVGTAGFTSYKVTPDICSYMMEKELIDCKTGLIHSHNNLNSFFSGTDNNTLLKEGIDSCHYLSLVVNNAGKYVARVTRKITESFIGKRVVKYSSYDNTEISNEEDCCIMNCENVEYSNLDIVIENSMKDTVDEIKERYNELVKQNKDAVTTQGSLFELNGGFDNGGSWSFQEHNEGNFYQKPFETHKSDIADKEVLPNKKTTDDTEPIFIDKEDATEMAAQILYGNITLSAEQFGKFNNVNSWITTGMTRTFDKRFHAEANNNSKAIFEYDDFMYSFIGVIISSYASRFMDEHPECTDEDMLNASIASSIQDVIDSIVIKAYGNISKTNPYIETINKNLELYING